MGKCLGKLFWPVFYPVALIFVVMLGHYILFFPEGIEVMFKKRAAFFFF